MMEMETLPVDCVLDATARLGESPMWNEAEQRLYWVDIQKFEIHRFDPSSGQDEVRKFSEQIGSLGFCSGGGLVAAMRSGFYRVDFETGTRTLIVDPEPDKPGNRLNDGRCDPWGAFWCGSMMDPSDRKTRTGTIWRLGSDGTVAAKVRDIGISNGIAFDRARKRFYCADTFVDVQTIWHFDVEPTTGAISNRQVFATTHDLPGRPDGGTVDAEGCYWSALANGWSLARWTPAGKLDRLLKLPVEKPTMPCFGGRELDTLFVTSIGPGYMPMGEGQPQAGGVFALRPGVKGVPEGRFAG
jgi:sugar lactone lactonase YvrE